MKNSDNVYLAHILDAITQIEIYTADISYDQFSQTKLVQDGVIRQLEIIGEASRNLSDDFRTEHSEPPWTEQQSRPSEFVRSLCQRLDQQRDIFRNQNRLFAALEDA